MDRALLWRFCHVSLTGAISSKYLLFVVRCPTLFYGMKAVHLSQIALKNIESTQGSLTIQALVLSKYSLHSRSLTTLNVPRCLETINNCRINLWGRIFKVDSQLRILCCYFSA